MSHLGLSLALALLIAPAAPRLPARIGDAARKLSSKDVASLELALEVATGTPRKPWLLIGGKSARGNFVVYAYVPEQQKMPNVRRSTKYMLTRLSPRMPWAVSFLDDKAGGNYAQVAIPGRSFDSITGDRDINQPFTISGDIPDADLVSIVAFTRSYPPFSISDPRSWQRIPSDGLIQSISVSLDGNRGVSFVNANGYSGLSAGLKAAGDQWIVTQSVNWVN